MSAVARGDEVDSVASPDGGGPNSAGNCPSPTTQATKECSETVFVEKIGVVRQGDKMIKHPSPPNCYPHEPVLSSYCTTVFVEGRGLGRKFDDFTNHKITSGAATVSAGQKGEAIGPAPPPGTP